MKKFLLVHVGFEPPTEEIMGAWMQWFASIESITVENLGPLGPGKEITPGGM